MASVGNMVVTVLQARGLGGLRTLVGKPAIYCVLELDDTKMETPNEVNTVSPIWNKTYTFPVNDITSSLVITVVDDTFITTTLGKISIPLLRINNNERRWFALNPDYTTGDCPRILLKMRVEWNVMKAALRTLTAKNTSYLDSEKEFSISMIYKNLQFLRGFFKMCLDTHDFYVNMFEWDSKATSLTALAAWILLCYNFEVWMVPAAVILLFFYYFIQGILFGFAEIPHDPSAADLTHIDDDEAAQANEEKFTDRLSRLKSVTITTQDGIDFFVMLIQKTRNLLMFHVPFLSFIAIIYLSVITLALYYIPIRVLLMTFGVVKFTRRLYRTKSSSSSHIIDFLFRVPNDQQLVNNLYMLVYYNGRRQILTLYITGITAKYKAFENSLVWHCRRRFCKRLQASHMYNGRCDAEKTTSRTKDSSY